MKEKLIQIRRRYVPMDYVIYYRIYDSGRNECCTYKNDRLVATVFWSYDTDLTEEFLDKWLELTPDWQKMPTVSQCPCEAK